MGRPGGRLGRLRPRRPALDLGLLRAPRRVPRLGRARRRGERAAQPGAGAALEHRQALPAAIWSARECRSCRRRSSRLASRRRRRRTASSTSSSSRRCRRGSNDTARYRAGEREAALAHVARLQAEGRVAMVQPYQHAVDEQGETALLFFDGRFSHAIRKGAIFAAGPQMVGGLFAREEIRPRERLAGGAAGRRRRAGVVAETCPPASRPCSTPASTWCRSPTAARRARARALRALGLPRPRRRRRRTLRRGDHTAHRAAPTDAGGPA